MHEESLSEAAVQSSMCCYICTKAFTSSCLMLWRLRSETLVSAASLLSTVEPPAVQAPEKRRWCDLCKGEVAKWITYDDTHSAKNPTFWCQKCYHLMHYDAEGDLKYHGFKAVPYTLEYAPRATVQLPKKGQ